MSKQYLTQEEIDVLLGYGKKEDVPPPLEQYQLTLYTKHGMAIRYVEEWEYQITMVVREVYGCNYIICVFPVPGGYGYKERFECDSYTMEKRL